MAWRINYGGMTLDEGDVTGAHLMMVGEVLGEHSWANANPMGDPRVLCAWVALVVAKEMQQPLDEAMAYVVSQPIGELVAAVETVDDPPLRAVPNTKAG